MTALPCGCPQHYPKEWDGQDVDIGGWLVHTQPAPMLLHFPIAFDLYRKRQDEDITRLGLKERWPGFALTLSAAFRGKHLRLLEEEECAARRVNHLPSPFRLRVAMHRGDIGSVKPVIRNMQTELIQEGRMPHELFLAYLTCPLCSDDRGGNRMMVLRRWKPSKKLKERLEKRQERLEKKSRQSRS
jgi:hypothetical protein